MKLRLKRFKRLLASLVVENFLLKILSMATAVILWLGVSSSVKTKYQFYSYVDIVNIPQDIEVVKIKPERVKVIIEARGRLFNRPVFEKVDVYVDGKKLKEGRNEAKVNVFVEGLEKDQLIIVNPESVIIYARKSTEKEVYR